MSDRTAQHHATHTTAEHLTMPENHLDTVVTPGSVDGGRRASVATVLFAVIILPLFLVTGFTLAYTSSQSHPVPHDLALTIAGPSSATSQVSSQIMDKAESAFDITRTTSSSQAIKAVKDRTAVGAIIIDGQNVETVIASGAGRLASAPVEQVGAQVAAALGGTVTVTDVAPVPSGDTSGTAMFYFIIMCTVGAYMSITVISQVLPKARVRTMMLVTTIAAILSPIIAFSMISIFVGDLGVSFGSVAAVIGVGMLYAFTVGTLATLFTRVLGQAAIFLVLLVLMFLNFPSTGGSVPESMLPGFWQFIHNGWVGSSAFETIRSILFFHGEQAGNWFWHLAVWAGAALVATVAVGIGQSRRAASQNADQTEPSAEAPSRDVAVAGGAFA